MKISQQKVVSTLNTIVQLLPAIRIGITAVKTVIKVLKSKDV